ncbi:hypothetical protein A5652_00540 [Mycobacterium sp. 1165178.9]|nr:hypothetical protein A5652_00540 [Mycobacterium sp. 1165178.9]
MGPDHRRVRRLRELAADNSGTRRRWTNRPLPLLDALADYRAKNRYGFTPPGHRQGRGTDDRVLEVLGREPFLDDVLASGGLDDRRTSNQYLKHAEDLMTEAVGAKMAWFSTCGS